VTTRGDDVEALRALAIRYAHYVDQHRTGELGEVFADDAVWDATATGFGRHVGLDAILSLMGRAEGHVAASSHCVVNHLVDRIDGDEAQGALYMFGESRLQDGTVRSFTSLVLDRYVRTEHGWRIRERVMTPLLASR
jgi:hypothetical protein